MENKTATTVNIFIQTEEFLNFATVDNMILDHFSEEGVNTVLDQFPFKAYTTNPGNAISVNIPLKRFVLLMASSKVF